MLDPVTQYELAQVIHQERLQELEKARTARQVRPSSKKLHSAILAGLGRGLKALGEQMQGDPERKQTPRHVSS